MRYFQQEWEDIQTGRESRPRGRESYHLKLRDFVPIVGLRDYCTRTRDCKEYDLKGKKRWVRNVLILDFLNTPFTLFMRPEKR